ncbi:hypothetical protein FFWV33_04120 [Flavobacterium faecale]|uniref:Uncharacterized protein n=1 Tax=Flavobacterium faecale TaxID=1355330 RepID=A0A2S1LAM0_9FLAO|nr:hypothetical protein FFWV33_04120 [Flavobacterium faecale]
MPFLARLKKRERPEASGAGNSSKKNNYYHQIITKKKGAFGPCIHIGRKSSIFKLNGVLVMQA